MFWISRQVSLADLRQVEIQRDENFLPFVSIVFLMPVNWLLESFKWRLLMRDKAGSSWVEFMVQVFNGLLYSWVLPFSTGDVVGRLERNTNHRWFTVKSIFINRVSSLGVTLVFGALGVLYYLDKLSGPLPFVVGVCVIGFMMFLLWNLGYAKIFPVVGLTLIRYVVFSLQFFICISLFVEISEPFWILAGICWVFLFRSTIPSLWGALGIREASAILFFSCCLQTVDIISSSLLLWLINLVLPSVLFAAYKIFLLIQSSRKEVVF